MASRKRIKDQHPSVTRAPPSPIYKIWVTGSTCRYISCILSLFPNYSIWSAIIRRKKKKKKSNHDPHGFCLLMETLKFSLGNSPGRLGRRAALKYCMQPWTGRLQRVCVCVCSCRAPCPMHTPKTLLFNGPMLSFLRIATVKMSNTMT